MKDIDNIKKRYFSGESTLQEERLLKEYLRTNSSDQIAPLFEYFDTMRDTQMKTPLKKPAARVFSVRMLMSIAASVVMLVAAVYTFQRPALEEKSTMEDPEVAMQVTLEALSLIGGKINKSEEVVRENVSKLDKTYIQKIL